MRQIPLALTAVACCLAAALAAAQAPEMPMPKPGPEHQVLKRDEGTWDAKVEMFTAPGAPPMVSQGVETNTMGCGGLCLISDFKGEMAPGQVFHGHGTSAWDPARKKYVGNWTDSMSAGITTGESSYDAAKKVFTGWMLGTDAAGKTVESKSVVEYKDDGTRVFTMYKVGAEGKETAEMRITYTRRK